MTEWDRELRCAFLNKGHEWLTYQDLVAALRKRGVPARSAKRVPAAIRAGNHPDFGFATKGSRTRYGELSHSTRRPAGFQIRLAPQTREDPLYVLLGVARAWQCCGRIVPPDTMCPVCGSPRIRPAWMLKQSAIDDENLRSAVEFLESQFGKLGASQDGRTSV